MAMDHIEFAKTVPPVYCKPTPIGYARLVGRCYIRRLEPVMAEESPLVRQWILLRTLCARRHGATVKEMAQEMGVSDKTIRRDLDTFWRIRYVHRLKSQRKSLNQFREC